jgi:hypothetical protein
LTESNSGEVAYEKVERSKNQMCQDLDQLGNELPEAIPELELRGSLGLYVYKGSASFRNTVLRPQLDQN